MNKTRLKLFHEWIKARIKARESRDKRILRQISIFEKQIMRLEKEADKTMDPVLRKRMEEAALKLNKSRKFISKK